MCQWLCRVNGIALRLFVYEGTAAENWPALTTYLAPFFRSKLAFGFTFRSTRLNIMLAINSPDAYRAPKHFEAEQKMLFDNTWLFAALRSEIGPENAYIRISLAGRDILLRNHQGSIRAFANICSHRHAQLCNEKQGRGLIRCPYHGWVYNGDGIPIGVPSKEQFPAVVASPQSFRQPEFEVESIGEFVFVRFDKRNTTLKEHLGASAQDFLVRVSGAAGHSLDTFSKDVSANWKVVIENALEGYHVPVVHPRTLGSAEGMATDSDAITENLESPQHSFMTTKADPAWLQKWDRKCRNIGIWPFRFNHYIHYFIFPNLTVTSFLGYSFHVQRFDPVSVESTRVESRILTSLFLEQNEIGHRTMEHVFKVAIDFTHRVFEEDTGICAKVQSGMHHATRQAILADDYEKRIWHFQNAYREQMGGVV